MGQTQKIARAICSVLPGLPPRHAPPQDHVAIRNGKRVDPDGQPAPGNLLSPISQTKQTSSPPSVTVRFTPPTGDDFDIYVTAVWLDAEKLRNITPEWLRNDAQSEADKLLSRALEKVAVLHELRGKDCVGFYYALTDRESKPGEYKYMTQGVFLTGELLTTFTALHRNMESPDVPKAPEALAGAAYTK